MARRWKAIDIQAQNARMKAEAHIIDLRQNGGGSPAMVALISSYLFNQKPNP